MLLSNHSLVKNQFAFCFSNFSPRIYATIYTDDVIFDADSAAKESVENCMVLVFRTSPSCEFDQKSVKRHFHT